MPSPIILVTVLLCIGVALSRPRLRIVALALLAGVAVLLGISHWLIATAPKVQGCAYPCSPREDAGVWLLFAGVGALIGGSLLLGGAALLLHLRDWIRARRRE